MCFALLFNKRLNTQQILHILHIYKTCKSHTSLWFIRVAMTNVTLCYWKRASNNVNTALTCTVGGLKPCVRDMSWVSVPFKKEHCVCCSNWPRFICIVSIFLAGVDVVKLLIDVSDTVWKIAANVANLSLDSLILLLILNSVQRNQSCSCVESCQIIPFRL